MARAPGFTRWLLRHWSADAAALGLEALEEFVRSSAEPARARAGQQLNWSFVTGDIPNVMLGRSRSLVLSTPTVLLVGDKDPLIKPAMVCHHRATAQGLTVRTVPGAGHLLPEEAPHEVANAARSLFVN
ncbi:MAG TPA: alpha/beta hydrolase [Acidimicrobiales bacterium]|nr:alpha/beta hydrolase [Acidimicrobiales bacterium]